MNAKYVLFRGMCDVRGGGNSSSICRRFTKRQEYSAVFTVDILFSCRKWMEERKGPIANLSEL